MNQNPLHKAIYEKVVLPELNKIAYDADGIIVSVNYYEQTVDVQWTESSTAAFRTAESLPIPKDADGVYRQTVKVGDKVRIGFRNGHYRYPYISMVYDLSSTKDKYHTRAGAGIPKGLSL